MTLAFAADVGTFGEVLRSGRVQQLFSMLNNVELTRLFNAGLIEIGVACAYRSTAALPRQQRVDAGYGNRGNTLFGPGTVAPCLGLCFGVLDGGR